MLHLALALPLSWAAGAAHADGVRVVADIAPVHALASRVMQGIAEPVLLVPPSVDEHGFALKPSAAAALQKAELVLWVGPELTPWLADPLASLAPAARQVALIDVPGVVLMDFRKGATFAAHDHVAREGEAQGGGSHDPDDAAETADVHTDEHADKHVGGAGHDHGGTDPHVWLDPDNAVLWLDVIAAELSMLDPENAAAYAANARAGAAEIAAAEVAIAGRMAVLKGRPFVVFHDAYHYFEAHFGIEAAGAITLGDATEPGAARLAEVRDLIRDGGIACIFAEPQFPQDLIVAAAEGSGARAGVLDPIGAALEPGAGLYPGILVGLATGLEDCLGGAG